MSAQRRDAPRPDPALCLLADLGGRGRGFSLFASDARSQADGRGQELLALGGDLHGEDAAAELVLPAPAADARTLDLQRRPRRRDLVGDADGVAPPLRQRPLGVAKRLLADRFAAPQHRDLHLVVGLRLPRQVKLHRAAICVERAYLPRREHRLAARQSHLHRALARGLGCTGHQEHHRDPLLRWIGEQLHLQRRPECERHAQRRHGHGALGCRDLERCRRLVIQPDLLLHGGSVAGRDVQCLVQPVFAAVGAGAQLHLRIAPREDPCRQVYLTGAKPMQPSKLQPRTVADEGGEAAGPPPLLPAPAGVGTKQPPPAAPEVEPPLRTILGRPAQRAPGHRRLHDPLILVVGRLAAPVGVPAPVPLPGIKAHSPRIAAQVIARPVLNGLQYPTHAVVVL